MTWTLRQKLRKQIMISNFVLGRSWWKLRGSRVSPFYLRKTDVILSAHRVHQNHHVWFWQGYISETAMAAQENDQHHGVSFIFTIAVYGNYLMEYFYNLRKLRTHEHICCSMNIDLDTYRIYNLFLKIV
mgnify:CR=1 FL=1